MAMNRSPHHFYDANYRISSPKMMCIFSGIAHIQIMLTVAQCVGVSDIAVEIQVTLLERGGGQVQIKLIMSVVVGLSIMVRHEIHCLVELAAE